MICLVSNGIVGLLRFRTDKLSLLISSLRFLQYVLSRSGARFSKVPKLFGRISGYIIHFVSSKRKRLEARNLAFILIFVPFITYEKTGFTELADRSFRNGFSGPESFRDFRETGARSLISRGSEGLINSHPFYGYVINLNSILEGFHNLMYKNQRALGQLEFSVFDQ